MDRPPPTWDDVRASEAKLHGYIEAHIADAQKAVDAAQREQERLADKLMLSSGAAAALLVTWRLTQSLQVAAADVVGPVVLLSLSFVLTAFGLWSRTIANLGISRSKLGFAMDLERMKREADQQFQQGLIGKVPAPAPGKPPPFPEKWTSTLDIILPAAFAAFVSGIAWAGFSLLA